ncbi:MAG: PA2778 family cysteine peptidase [Pseudomonadota bacterium]|nr:PA2778 family cysteine peptidase [Pseudomonadota bacterium]
MSSVACRSRLAAAAASLWLGACVTIHEGSTPASRSGVGPAAVELAAVPFFPQEIHACGPAALAELLVREGVDITPEVLSDEVYLPGREGTLAPELVASVRRHGLLPELLPARSEAVLHAVAQGRPVLVLQNLGLDMLPHWHYAVVVGYDLGRQEVLLRSGLERRQRMSLFTFEQTWLRGGGFALTAVRPDQLPLYATAAQWLQTLTDAHAPAAAWERAAKHWPGSAAASFGLANARLARPQPDLHAAEQALSDAIRDDPDFLPAYNNLALVLARQNNWVEARKAIEGGIARIGVPPASPAAAALLPAFEDTRRQVLAGRLDPPAGAR